MSELTELSVDEIKNGFHFDKQENKYVCNYCGKEFYNGEIFKYEDRYFDSSKAVEIHIVKEHQSVYEMLTKTDKKYLGITDNQKQLLDLIGMGITDSEIAKRLGISPSTVRHQKFMFREKAKQAKMYLAVYELIFHNSNQKQNLVNVHNTATMVDDRYITTTEESEKIIKNSFLCLNPLQLKAFPAKEKKKIIILKKIMEQFDKGRSYKEKEVNQILKGIYDDFPTLRRYLIEYGFMERTDDCLQYKVKE